MRILVVGAGPTGLTAALELRRRGIEADVIDRQPGPSPLSRAVGIQTNSMRILEPSGASAAIEAEAVAFTALRVHAGARPLATIPLGFDAETRVWGLAQDRTEHHLARALVRYGGMVRYGVQFTGLSQDAEGVTVTTPAGETRYDHVIGADGTQSAVRQALGIAYEGINLPGVWSIADVEAPDWPDPTMFKGYMLSEGNVCVVAPLTATRFRVIASLPDALAALPVPMTVTTCHRSGTFSISVRLASRYGEGRVYLAGDAAHCHSPAGGRGMNLGIADAADLARRFAEGGLEGYGDARHAEGRATIRLSETIRRVLQARNPAARATMRGVMGLLDKVPAMQRMAARRFVGGLR